MKSNIDIRRITLIKRYHPDQITESQFGWYVFGYYDRMNVEEIHIDSFSHPLERILDDAQTQSLSNSASTKQHVIYAIGAEQRKSHKAFWDTTNRYPLLLVSLIHLNHPLLPDDNTEGDRPRQPNLMNQYIDSIKQSIQAKNDGNDIQFSVYFSIDCNDLIVFWSATSFQKTMELVARVCDYNSSLIGELFTIQACDNAIMSKIDNDSKLCLWKQQEPVFKCVRIHLRSTSFSKLLDRIKDLPQDIKKREQKQSEESFNCYATEYVVPGQDDVVLAFHNIPLDWLLDMYAPASQSSISSVDSLCGLLYEGLLSRSVIDTELVIDDSHRTQDNHQEGNNYNPHRDITLESDIKERIDSLTKCIQENSFTRTIWLPALYELLFELANLETSSTAYDIYVQAAPCHRVLVDELKARISDTREARELQKPNTTVVRNIQQYLHGWSQLSFHAMHAEWQLTQTSEMNRLYIFPAKLNRLYSAFMDKASVILNSGCKSPQEGANFFLTPTIGSEAEFTAVFNPSKKACSLVLGEIPADLMYAPQLFLPLLVHEAAHYAGHEHRQRKLRYESVLRSVLFYMLSTIFQHELVYMPLQRKDGISTVGIEVVEQLVKSFPDFESPQNAYGTNRLDEIAYYSRDIRAHIGYHVSTMMADSDRDIQPAILHVLHTVPFFEYVNHMRMDLYYHSQIRTTQRIFALQAIGTDLNLNSYLDQLLTIYSEAFSDLCMIQMLSLSVEEYLRVIYKNNRYSLAENADTPTLSDWSYASLSERIRYERYLCVILAAYPSISLSALLKKLDTQSEIANIGKGKKITKADMQGVYALASALEKINSTPESSKCLPYERGQLLVYLDSVSHELNSLFESAQRDGKSTSLMKEIYQTLAFDLQFYQADEKSIIEILTPCIKMMHETSTSFNQG